MKLSERLNTVVSFVKPGSRVVDVGTDHGYVPIELAQRGIIIHGLAMDVRKGPLERAKEHIRQYGLEDVIETRLSDGICQLQDHEADTVIVAGMGGELVIHILEEGRRFWDQIGHWILSPQSELDKVRDYLVEQGFAIERETMLKEEGKYYVVMDVVRGQMESLKPWESLYGPLLLKEKNPVLAELLQKEKTLCESILKGLAGQESESAGKRAEELGKQIRWIEEAQHEMQ